MDDISKEIQIIDQQLQKLEEDRQVLLERRQRLIAVLDKEQPTAVALSPGEKIHLFQSLFKGRDDVIAVRWQSNNSGRSGYSPACHNEWRPGICQKPKVKCTDCPHQNFEQYTEQAVHSHLTWKRTLGIYPPQF